jgi:Fe2+ transport system protein FeoA
MLLKNLKNGQRGRIRAILSKGLHCRRLCEMGFLPGTAFRIRHVAPLGSPIAVELRGYEVIIGSRDAELIEAEAVE